MGNSLATNMTIFLVCENVYNDIYFVLESFEYFICCVLKHKFPEGYLHIFEALYNFVKYLRINFENFF